MAIGDDAAAAGMDVVSPLTDLVKDGADEITKSRDYIAQRTSAVTPVAKGGTGAITAADARTNLGTHDAANITEGTITRPINTSGTITANGNIISNAAVAALGGINAGNGFGVGGTGRGIDGAGNATFGQIICGDIFTGGGRLNSVGSRNFPVSVNYASAYMDGDSWLGITPSALRFKQDVQRADYTLAEVLRLAQCVATYRLKSAVEKLGEDATGEVGVIADWLLAAGFAEFVIFDAAGRVQSVAYERLVVVVLGGLAELAGTVDDLAKRVAALEPAAPDESETP